MSFCPRPQQPHILFVSSQKHDLDVAFANIFTIESPENKITHLKRKATESRLCAHWVAPWLPIYGRHVLVLLSSPNGFQACAKLSYVKLQTRWLFEPNGLPNQATWPLRQDHLRSDFKGQQKLPRETKSVAVAIARLKHRMKDSSNHAYSDPSLPALP